MSKRRVSAKKTNSFKKQLVITLIFAWVFVIFLGVLSAHIGVIFFCIIGMGFSAYRFRYVFILKNVYIDDTGVFYSSDSSNDHLLKWKSIISLDVVQLSMVDLKRVYVLHSYDDDKIAFTIDGDINREQTSHAFSVETQIRDYLGASNAA